MKIRMKYRCKDTAYLVTFSKSLDIAFFDKIVSFQRRKKGNKVTGILHPCFKPLGMRPRQLLRMILARLTRRKAEGGE